MLRRTPAARPRRRAAALPAVTIASYVCAFATVPVARRARRHLPDDLADLLVSAGAATVTCTLLALAERLAPAREDWSGGHGELPTDIGYLTVVLPPTAVASQMLADALTPPMTRALRGRRGRSTWPARAPLAARVALALAVTELIHYWHHRLSHEVGAMWDGHAPHHSATTLRWITAARVHPLDQVPLMATQVATIAALGIDRDALLVHNTLKSYHGMLQHANVAGSTRPLDVVLSTAELHREHHALAADGPTANYGAVLSVWDRVFGTHRPARSDGFTGEVGIAAPYPTSVTGQALQPVQALARRLGALA